MQTFQQIFNTVYNGLKAQGFEKSVAKYLNVQSAPGHSLELAERNACAYRGEDNLCCAFGHIIPDDAYDPILEGSSAMGLLLDTGLETIDNWFNDGNLSISEEIKDHLHTKRAAMVKFKEWAKDNIPKDAVEFIADLQCIHDCAIDAQEMQRKLESFAENNNLEIPVN